MKCRLIYLALANILAFSYSCNRGSEQEVAELVWAACEPYDSLTIYVWHTVNNGIYIGNYCSHEESDVLYFKAQFDAGFIQRQLGGNLNRVPVNITMLDEKASDGCCLEDVIRLMREQQIIRIDYGKTGLYFIRGNIFHSAVEYNRQRSTQQETR